MGSPSLVSVCRSRSSLSLTLALSSRSVVHARLGLLLTLVSVCRSAAHARLGLVAHARLGLSLTLVSVCRSVGLSLTLVSVSVCRLLSSRSFAHARLGLSLTLVSVCRFAAHACLHRLHCTRKFAAVAAGACVGWPTNVLFVNPTLAAVYFRAMPAHTFFAWFHPNTARGALGPGTDRVKLQLDAHAL
jgi:hypothetical protein